MRLLPLIIVSLLLGCGGDAPEEYQRRQLEQTTLQASEDLVQTTQLPRPLPLILHAEVAPGETVIDETSAPLRPDHYSLSDDQTCGHTECPADPSVSCDAYDAGGRSPKTVCACRVRDFLFVCH